MYEKDVPINKFAFKGLIKKQRLKIARGFPSANFYAINPPHTSVTKLNNLYFIAFFVFFLFIRSSHIRLYMQRGWRQCKQW